MFISDSEKYAFLACNNTAYTGSFLYSLDIEKEKFTVMQKILANNFLEVRFQYDEYLFALTDSKLLFFIQTTNDDNYAYINPFEGQLFTPVDFDVHCKGSTCYIILLNSNFKIKSITFDPKKRTVTDTAVFDFSQTSEFTDFGMSDTTTWLYLTIYKCTDPTKC